MGVLDNHCHMLQLLKYLHNLMVALLLYKIHGLLYKWTDENIGIIKQIPLGSLIIMQNELWNI